MGQLIYGSRIKIIAVFLGNASPDTPQYASAYSNVEGEGWFLFPHPTLEMTGFPINQL